MPQKYYIGVNGTILSPGRADGFARVTSDVIKALKEKNLNMIIFSNSSRSLLDTLQIRVPQLFSEISFLGHLTRILWHQTILPFIVKNKISIYYSPTPDGMLWPTIPQITTIYDLIMVHYPEYNPKFKYYYKIIIPQILKTSSVIIAGSYYTKNDIENHYPQSKNKVIVVYPGYDKEVFKEQEPPSVEATKKKYNLKKYILCVSVIRPYKNVRKLIDAYALLHNEDVQLVIVGQITKLEKDIEAYAISKCKNGNIKLLKYVPDNDLPALYAGAMAFVYPSLYEGFGLTPLEAMACGCPVIVSNASSLPEVCGDAGYYFSPYNTEEMATAINKVLNDKNLQKELAIKGLEQVKKFSFENTAERLINIFNAVLHQ